MPGERRDTQKVEAFTAPKDLLRDAQIEAKRRHMSKSGFYRYCLAKELGKSEAEALLIAEHASIGNFQVINAGTVAKIENNFSPAPTVPAASGPQKYPKGKRRNKKTEK